MNKTGNDIVITHYARTAIDKFGGVTYKSPTHELLKYVLEELIKRSGLKPEQIDEINNGSACCIELGLNGDIPIRQALLNANFPYGTISNMVDRACCSPTTALQMTFRNIALGEANVAMVTGGDNMGRYPITIDPIYRKEPFRVMSKSMLWDPLAELGYKGFGVLAQDAANVALSYGITKEMQDEWAYYSHVKWGKAFEKGYFEEEIFPIEFSQGRGKPPVIFNKDQSPRPNTTLEEIASLPLVNGSKTVTAGNAPGLNAGASGVICMTRSKAEQLGFAPLARVLTVASIAEQGSHIAISPATAINKGLSITGLKLDDIELIEINEAFAAMPVTSTKLLADGDTGKWDYLKSITNVNGGAVAIGHPIGGTGMRLVMTCIRELKARGGKYGACAICGGLGQGDAVILEVE